MSSIFAWFRMGLEVIGLYRTDRSEYAYPHYVDALISDNQWLQELNNDNNPCMVDVNLRQSVHDNARTGYRFKLRWGNLLERKCPMILFFPNHPDKNMQILYTHKASSLSDLDKDINDRLEKSKIHQAYDTESRTVGQLLMAIASGHFIYRIWGIDKNHNLYLYWLTHLNTYNIMGACDSIRTKLPTLAEMDGSCNIVNIVPLDFTRSSNTTKRIHEPLNLNAHERSYIRITRTGETLFNLERDVRQEQSQRVKTTSDATATNDIRSMSAVGNVFHTVSAEDFPLDEPMDSMDDSTGEHMSTHYTNPSPSGSDCSNDDSDYVIEESVITLSMASPRTITSDRSKHWESITAVDAFLPDEGGADDDDDDVVNNNNDNGDK